MQNGGFRGRVSRLGSGFRVVVGFQDGFRNGCLDRDSGRWSGSGSRSGSGFGVGFLDSGQVKFSGWRSGSIFKLQNGGFRDRFWKGGKVGFQG